MGDLKWCGDIFSRHGGSQFIGWWSKKYMQNVPIQVDDIPNNMSYNYTYTHYHMFLLMMLIQIKYAKIYTKLGWPYPFPMR